MKKKALALAVASALIAPSAFAATDTSGMRYTSASEGFYGSIRARYVTAKSEGTGANIENSSSRVGVSGTADLGGGLTGFYTWELGTGIDDGADVNVRVGNVGLRGDFGEISAGSFWAFDYGATYSASDQANVSSGNFVYDANREGRATKSIQYTTPDFNGFQSALLFSFDKQDATKAVAEVAAVCVSAGAATPPVTGALQYVACATDTSPFSVSNTQRVLTPGVTGVPVTKDENDLDSWNLSASYAVQGFTLGGAYNVRPDALTKRVVNVESTANTVARDESADSRYNFTKSKTDAKSWSIRGSYGQDNWNFNSWYGVDNTSDQGFNDDAVVGKKVNQQATTSPAADIIPSVAPTKAEDTTIIGLHAGVAVDKVNLYAVYESRENSSKQEDVYTTLGVQYSLGARSRTWLEYASQDLDSNPDAEDYVSIGLRFDF